MNEKSGKLKSAQEIYLEVVDIVKEKLPDANIDCISVNKSMVTGYLYTNEKDRYKETVIDLCRVLSTLYYYTEADCKQAMIERIITCNVKNKIEKEKLLKDLL